MRKIIVVTPNRDTEVIFSDKELDAMSAARLFACYSLQFSAKGICRKNAEGTAVFDFSNQKGQ
jgi:hypothetical protein